MDKYIQRDSDGTVDVEASAKAYATALTEWCAKNEVAADKIATAVNTVLDRHTGRVQVPALLSMAVHELGGTLENYKVLSSRVHAYVKGQAAAKLLFVVNGKGGGVSREPRTTKSA
jgi:hypothetical protein